MDRNTRASIAESALISVRQLMLGLSSYLATLDDLGLDKATAGDPKEGFFFTADKDGAEWMLTMRMPGERQHIVVRVSHVDNWDVSIEIGHCTVCGMQFPKDIGQQ